MKLSLSRGLGLDVRFSLQDNELRTIIIEMESKNVIMLTVPGSFGQTCVNIELAENGKLRIIGGASIIDAIVGEGMSRKVKKS